MNSGYHSHTGPDWCSVIRIPTQTTWQIVDARAQEKDTLLKERKERVDLIKKPVVNLPGK